LSGRSDQPQRLKRLASQPWLVSSKTDVPFTREIRSESTSLSLQVPISDTREWLPRLLRLPIMVLGGFAVRAVLRTAPWIVAPPEAPLVVRITLMPGKQVCGALPKLEHQIRNLLGRSYCVAACRIPTRPRRAS
jgi:hypothetical protein